MSVTIEADQATTAPRGGHEASAARASTARSFFGWGTAVYLGTVIAMVTAIVTRLGGHLVYVLDDPAIHLSVADQLVRHQTWGVTSGSFESASSAPLWTVAIAVTTAPFGAAHHWMPLLLNLVAGVAVIGVFAYGQDVLRPSRRRPLDLAMTAVLVAAVLFLPGLAVVGMEHSVHVALVLGAVVVCHRRSIGLRDRLPPWTPYALLAVATLTRFETLFVAAGLAAGWLVVGTGDARRRVVLVLASSVLPTAAFAAWNRAMGGGWLPNSVLAKGQGLGAARSQSDGLGPVDIASRLTHDPLVAVMFALSLGYLVLTWRRPATAKLPAVTLVVAASLHAALADVGWYDRYQAYLIAIGAYLALAVIAEVPADLRQRGLIVALLVFVVFGAWKVNLLADAPLAADDMYRHQYQAGRFVDRYYDNVPIATDQLGYISLFHDGPLTDFAGLGDYGLLKANSGLNRPESYADLARQRGFRIVVVYDVSALHGLPDTWVLAGQWRLEGEPVVGVSDALQFYATSPRDVAPLQEQLRSFEKDLPPRVSLEINEFAELQIAKLEAEGGV